MAAKFQVYYDKVGKFRFRVKTGNGTRAAMRDSVCLTADCPDLRSGGNGVESRSVSLEAAMVTSLTCGVIVAVLGHDRGRGLWEVFLLLTRLDEMVLAALFRL